MTTLPANQIFYNVVPSGGIVTLLFQSYDTAGTWTITRAGNGQTLTLYNGPPIGNTNGTYWKWNYIDTGDGTNLPLAANVAYTYTFSSTNAESAVEVITPACSITIQMDSYLAIIMRCLQAGLNNIALPISGPGLIRKPTIQIAMPLTGAPQMPLISVAPVMLQQDKVPIGHAADYDYQHNKYNIYELVMRRYSVSIFSETVLERDFYVMAVITVFKASLYSILNQMGQDVSTSFSASYNQVTDPQPGFYLGEVSLEFTGNLIALVTTDYGPVNAVDVTVTPESTNMGVG